MAQVMVIRVYPFLILAGQQNCWRVLDYTQMLPDPLPFVHNQPTIGAIWLEMHVVT